MEKLFRWILGYVSFTAEGGFVERFLNLCKINGISLSNVVNNGVKVDAITSKNEFEKISIPAEKSGMELASVSKRGLPFLLERYKYRVGVIIGLLVAMLFIFYMSGCVWSIEIIEKNSVKLENFTDELGSLGVKIGARKSKIDILEVQQELLDKYPQLSWISLNIFGSKAQIEYTTIKENKPIDDAKTPKNIIAAKKGKVVLVEGYRGKNEVKEGDYVYEGQLLISGVMENADKSESFLHAKGKVFALTEDIFSYEENIKNHSNVIQKTENLYYIKLFGLDIPLGIDKNGVYKTLNYIIPEGNGMQLPIGAIRKDYMIFLNLDTELSVNVIKLGLLLSAVEDKRQQYDNAEFEKITYNINADDEKIELKMKVRCVENIAIEGEVFVEEN